MLARSIRPAQAATAAPPALSLVSIGSDASRPAHAHIFSSCYYHCSSACKPYRTLQHAFLEKERVGCSAPQVGAAAVQGPRAHARLCRVQPGHRPGAGPDTSAVRSPGVAGDAARVRSCRSCLGGAQPTPHAHLCGAPLWCNAHSGSVGERSSGWIPVDVGAGVSVCPG